jgi:hypothetical protein
LGGFHFWECRAESESASKLDVIVVYKVDRLTQSLADFAKLVELFDAHGVSFVSVTRQFNTMTSMGRLTLNVLLSFACSKTCSSRSSSGFANRACLPIATCVNDSSSTAPKERHEIQQGGVSPAPHP